MVYVHLSLLELLRLSLALWLIMIPTHVGLCGRMVGKYESENAMLILVIGLSERGALGQNE